MYALTEFLGVSVKILHLLWLAGNWTSSGLSFGQPFWIDAVLINKLVPLLSNGTLGAVHKVRHAQGGGVQEDVTVCDKGEGVKSMWRHAYNFFIIHMKHEI